MFTRLLWGESGQGLTEYALLLGLIAVVCVAAVVGLGNSITGVHNKYSTEINTRLGGS